MAVKKHETFLEVIKSISQNVLVHKIYINDRIVQEQPLHKYEGIVENTIFSKNKKIIFDNGNGYFQNEEL